jgi:hypothetical protein
MVDLADKVKIPGTAEFYKITTMIKPNQTNIDLTDLRDKGFLLNRL